MSSSRCPSETIRPAARAIGLLALWALSRPALALEWKLADEVQASLKGTVTLGTALRTEAPDAAVLGTLSTARVGLPPGQLGGNAGGNDLDFEKNRPVSTVLKGLIDFELNKQGFSLFVRAKAWYDQELENGRRPYGNTPNGFAQNVPLSDQGFDPHARFSNALIEDVYVNNKFELGEVGGQWRAGRHVVPWGVAQFTGGGVNIVNPVDVPATLRPGALVGDETRIPVAMFSGSLAPSANTSLEAWLQIEFRHNVLAPCGTFNAVANYAPTGCSYVSVLGGAGVDDPSALASGRYPKRSADVEARDWGQFGLSLAHRLPPLGTELRAYAANYHSRAPSIRVINPNLGGGFGTLGAAPTRLTDPNGLKYAMMFAEDIRLFGLSASQTFAPTLRAYGELAYRRNQPLAINASDLIAAFLTRAPNSALQLAKGTNALPPGATFDGFDRFKTTTLTLGAIKTWLNLAGASRIVLAGEVGFSRVAGLPDPGTLRYGRSDDYGLAAVSGGAACVDNTAAQKACARDGFVTSSAWGYRLRVAATYPGLFAGGTLTPSLQFGHDVSGYSFDGTFLEGRQQIRAALRMEWARQYSAEMIYTRWQGGRYFNQTDRDTLALAGGLRF
jgi:Protein of unknown function (DUF1302)